MVAIYTKKMGRLTITATAPTQWTQTIINFLHHKIFSLRATPEPLSSAPFVG